VEDAPKAYKVEPLVVPKPSLVQIDEGYDHWTFERLGNSSEPDWIANSPMAAYGVEPYHLV